MPSERPEDSARPTGPLIGRGTLERLLVSEDSGSLTPKGEARVPLAPQPDGAYSAHQDDDALDQALSAQPELLTLCGGSERDREQLLLRFISRAGHTGATWLWLELNGEPNPAALFEQLFGALHIPVPFGLSQLITSMSEEGSLDRSLSEEARGEYELSREILCSSLLIRRVAGLALHTHDEPRAHELELSALIEELKGFAARVPVLLSLPEAPEGLSALRVTRSDQRQLPTLSGYGEEQAGLGRERAAEELLLTLRLAQGSVCADDVSLLAPAESSAAPWSRQELVDELTRRELIKRVEGGSYLMTSAGRVRVFELLRGQEPEERARLERRFVSCFARYGAELIQELDGPSGGALIERYIEAKPQLDAALDVALAYSWSEVYELTLGLCALAERHGPALIGLRAINLATRSPLPREAQLKLELTSFMLQETGEQSLIPRLEALREQAEALESDELYVQTSYQLAKVMQHCGDNMGAYQIMRGLRQRFDGRVASPLMVRVMNTQGFACFLLKRDEEAYQVLTEAIDRARRAGHLRFEALALTNLGVLHSRRGEHEEARTAHQAAIQIHQHLRSYVSLCPSLCNLADAYRLEGRHEEALRLFERCLKVSVSYGNSSILALLWSNIGEQRFAVGSPQEAEQALCKGIDLLKSQGNVRIAGLFLGTLGLLYSEAPEGARSYEAHEAFMEGEQHLRGIAGFETERAKLWLKWSLARLTWAQYDEARLAYDFAFQLCSIEDDVELKAWCERVQAEARRAGLNFPTPL